jgi:uncharacterized membrane protein
VLSAGVAFGAICFLVAGVAEILGLATQPAAIIDVGAVVDGLGRLDAWAWASLGTLIVVATPAVGLVATAAEYAVASDRSTLLLALVVLAVLALSTVVAVAR